MDRKAKPGLAMYTVHQAVGQDMRRTFEQLADIGYEGVEFYGDFHGFSREETKRALQESGLIMTGWHVEWRDLQKTSCESTLRYLQEAGCPIAVVPCLGGKWNVGHDKSGECKDRWLYYADWLNKMEERLKREGIRLAYHNHEHEFLLSYDGKTVFELLYEHLSPSVIMELDTGNCIEGGYDPADILRKYKERDVLLHLKPYSSRLGFDVVLGEKEDENNWDEILCQTDRDFLQLLVESENTRLPELENAERCFSNLKQYL